MALSRLLKRRKIMRKTMKRILATAFAGILALTGTTALKAPVSVSAEESTDSYEVFVAIGADKTDDGDWGYQYYGTDGIEGSDGITATTAEISVGETVTVGLEFDTPVKYTWFVAPTMVAENVTSADFDVQVLVDGEEVDTDLSAGDNWWYEGTGDYDDSQAVRIAGGYNEWGDQYIECPTEFSKIEFVITANSIETGTAVVGDAVESTETYDAFIAFGGDLAEENDWGLQYYGEETPQNGITVENGTITSGGSTTITMTFDEPVPNVWFYAPVIVAENVVSADFTIEEYIDGEQVDIDTAAGDAWWYEGTGEYDDTQAIRLAGGYNEWGDQYVAEPSDFTEIKFVITANSIMVGEATSTDASTAGEVDLDGVYHAYIGFQTPKYSFRNSWSGDSGYGHDTDEFNQVTGWDSNSEEIVVPGTFQDVEIAGNGTYTVSVTGLEFPDGEFDSQEYMNLIFFSTDIPVNDTIQFSDVTLKVDGSTVSSTSPKVNPEAVNYLEVQVQSTYSEDENLKTIGYYNAAGMSEMSITFTVSGFNYDNPDATIDEATEATSTDTDEATTTPTTEKKSNTVVIVIIVVAVVVVIAVVAVVVAKKKKKN
jgi:hypothetical protein